MEAMFTHSDRELTQEELAEFLEDYADLIDMFESLGGENKMRVSVGISAIRSMQFKEKTQGESEVKTFSVNRSLTESIDIESIGGNHPPSEIVISIVPYIGLGVTAFRFRLKVRHVRGSPEPKFTLSMIRRFETLDGISDRFHDRVVEGVSSRVSVVMGSVNTE